MKISKKRGKSRFEGLSELQTFQKFFTKAIIRLVVIATNSYAARQRSHSDLLYTRTWKDTTIGEIYRYIGVWLYMGMHQEAVRAIFWSPTHQLSRYLSHDRFEQIHRYFSTRDEVTSPRQQGETFAWKIEPIATFLRQNILMNWLSGTHLAVDEAMIAFRGRTNHKVKMKNKPINEGYKTWMIAENDYTLVWL